MTTPTLYFHPTKGKYYHVGDTQCTECKKVIDDIFLFVRSVGGHFKRDILVNKSVFTQMLCKNCMGSKNILKKWQKLSVIGTNFFVIIVASLPRGSQPYFFNSVEIVPSTNRSSFEITFEEGSMTVDNTRYANRESFEGAQIGADVSAILSKVAEFEKPLVKLEHAKQFLAKLKDAVPMIEGKEVRRIEGR